MEFACTGVQKGWEISRDPKRYEEDENGHPFHKIQWALNDGVSYYSNNGVNKAHIMPDDMVRVLKESKE